MSTAAASEVDPAIWSAVAGTSVDIPPINSYVYYFPQGHLEHTSCDIRSADFSVGRSVIPCQVLSVSFRSSTSFDQVFAVIRLQPVQDNINRSANGVENRYDDVVSFAKILTPSDANNGGGFSVPRFCADSIFPPLDFAADPPVQNLTVKDTLSNAWTFRHIYRGTPRRHLITTGWGKFVNAKRLITGDSVVFMRKKSTSELFAGIRRAAAIGAVSGNGGDRSGEVMEAIETAVKGEAFEVVYYPRFGSPDFVVRAEKVEAALRMCWSVGMRMKMAVETEDLLRVTWCQGTIAGILWPASGPWLGSPWRMLKITWDEPETMPNMNRVNPWQVEYIPPVSELYTSIHPPKRFKALDNSMMSSYAAGGLFFPRTEPEYTIGVHLTPTVVNHSLLLPSMQGARLNQIHNPKQTFIDLLKNENGPEVETVSTVLNIGSPYMENRSPESQTSVQYCGTDLVRGNSLTRAEVYTIKLFGQTIQVPGPVEVISENNGRCRDGERNDEPENRNVNNNPPQL